MADCSKNLHIKNRNSSCQGWPLHDFQTLHFICNRFGCKLWLLSIQIHAWHRFQAFACCHLKSLCCSIRIWADALPLTGRRSSLWADWPQKALPKFSPEFSKNTQEKHELHRRCPRLIEGGEHSETGREKKNGPTTESYPHLFAMDDYVKWQICLEQASESIPHWHLLMVDKSFAIIDVMCMTWPLLRLE